jgi:serine/threonine-protein kinase HipA
VGLDVYLSGERVGNLSRVGRGCSFAYAPELAGRSACAALDEALPVRADPYGPAETGAYLERLLPSGERRLAIARELCIDPGDAYALIAELGRDCLGAVVFLPAGERPEPRDADSLAWLSEDELEQVVAAPERGLFDPRHRVRMRFALPGTGHRLALIRDAAGERWAWPEPGAPSTHIVEPAGGEPLSAADLADLDTIAGHPCLVRRRGDRRGEGAGAERLHRQHARSG